MATQLLLALLSAALALLVGLILWRIRREPLALQYEVVESQPFPREGGQGQFFVVTITNTGKRPTERVDLDIQFPAGRIETVKPSNERLITGLGIEPNRLTGTIPLLNPRETLKLTVTTLGSPDLAPPTVLARAVGVTAARAKPPEASQRELVNLTVMAVAMLAAFAIGLLVVQIWSDSSWRRETTSLVSQLERQRKLLAGLVEEGMPSKETPEGKADAPEREQLIFAILNRAGVSHVFPQLLTGGSEITYWRTGFALIHWFLIDSANRQKYLDAMDALLELRELAPKSRAILLYLSAKMEQFMGSQAGSRERLSRLKSLSPSMYEHLMAQDPFYDLEGLRRWLVKIWGGRGGS